MAQNQIKSFDSDSSKKAKRILVFDVETSGLIPKDRTGVTINDLPYILQLTFVIFETKGWKITRSVNTYINVAPNVPISPKITELTGITREMCDKGISMKIALQEFAKEYMQCDIIVAHNIQFDREMIRIELERNKDSLTEPQYALIFDREFERHQNKFNYCTMYNGKNACKIERTDPKGEVYYKSPKLVELYEHLFHMTPHNLHDSLIDTFVCLRCFIKLRFKFDLSLKGFPDITFTSWINPAEVSDTTSKQNEETQVQVSTA